MHTARNKCIHGEWTCGSVYLLLPLSLTGSKVTLLDFARAFFGARSMLHRYRAPVASLLFACSCLTPQKIRADVCGKPSKDSWEGECLKSAVRFRDEAITDPLPLRFFSIEEE